MIRVMVEFTDNLGPEADVPDLLRKLDAHLRERLQSEHLLVAARSLTDYVAPVAAGGWATVTARITAPRARQALFEAGLMDELLSLAEAHFSELFARRSIAVSLQLETTAGEASFERLHPQPRAAEPF